MWWLIGILCVVAYFAWLLWELGHAAKDEDDNL